MLKYFKLISFILTISFCINNTAKSYDIFSDEEEISSQEIKKTNNDIFEGLNRKIYKFNHIIDKYTLKPITKTYIKIIPIQARSSVNNFLNNFFMPISMINALLQLNFTNFANLTKTYILNSTIGIAGLFNPAKHFNIPIHKEDLGQTAAKYNIPSGPYLVIPFLGPSTLRNLISDAITVNYNPLWAVAGEDSEESIKYSTTGLSIINTRAKLLDVIDDVEQNSLDPYSVIKSMYLQNQEALINNK